MVFLHTDILTKHIVSTARARFIDQQAIVFSKFLLFEAKARRKHAHLAHGEPLLSQVFAKLEADAHGQVEKVMSTISHREYAKQQISKAARKQRGTSKVAIRSFLGKLQVLKEYIIMTVSSWFVLTYQVVIDEQC